MDVRQCLRFFRPSELPGLPGKKLPQLNDISYLRKAPHLPAHLCRAFSRIDCPGADDIDEEELTAAIYQVAGQVQAARQAALELQQQTTERNTLEGARKYRQANRARTREYCRQYRKARAKGLPWQRGAPGSGPDELTIFPERYYAHYQPSAPAGGPAQPSAQADNRARG